MLHDEAAQAREEQFKARKVHRTVMGSDADVFAAAISLGAPAGVSRVEAQELVWVEGDDEPVVGPWLADALAPGSSHPFTFDPEDLAAFKEYVPDGAIPGSALATPVNTPARSTASPPGGLRVEDDEEEDGVEMDLYGFLCATADARECHVPPTHDPAHGHLDAPSPAVSLSGASTGASYGPAAALAMGFRVDGPDGLSQRSLSVSSSRPASAAGSRTPGAGSRRGSHLSVPHTPSGPSASFGPHSRSRSRRSTPSPNFDPFASPMRAGLPRPNRSGSPVVNLNQLPSPSPSPSPAPAAHAPSGSPTPSDSTGASPASQLTRALALSRSIGAETPPRPSSRGRGSRTTSLPASRTPSLRARALSPLLSEDYDEDLALELDGPPPMLPMPSLDASVTGGSVHYEHAPSTPYRPVAGKQYGGFALYDDGHAELIEVVEDLDMLEVDDPNSDTVDMQKTNANAPALARLLESMRSFEDV
jgi:hypothetical protein